MIREIPSWNTTRVKEYIVFEYHLQSVELYTKYLVANLISLDLYGYRQCQHQQTPGKRNEQ